MAKDNTDSDSPAGTVSVNEENTPQRTTGDRSTPGTGNIRHHHHHGPDLTENDAVTQPVHYICP
nr:hypothetical protein [Salmonella sp. SG203]